MHQSIRQLEVESLLACLAPVDPLAQAIYALYQCRPAATQERRVVVLTGTQAQQAQGRWAFSSRLEIDTVCELLWETLSRCGERVGTVVYNSTPVEGDYIIHSHDDGYRVAKAHAAAEPLLGVA